MADAFTILAELPPFEAVPVPGSAGRENLTEWLAALRAAGIAADRATAPDLIGQLEQTLRRPVDRVICSALDGDPAVDLQDRWARERVEDLQQGLATLAALSGAAKVSVAVDAQRPLARRLRGDRTVSVERLDNVYPQADPSILVYSVTKRRLRPGRLPTLQGVLLTDAVAAVAIGALVRRGEPMRQVPLCFRDRAGNGQMVIAPVGMTLGDAIRRAGFDRLPHLRQGALLSERVATREQAIGSGELVFHALADAPPVTADACVRCGWCLDVCPTRVSPVALLDARQQGNHLDLADAAGLHACVECGLCSFVCPSRLDLLTAIRQLKSAAS